MIEFLCDDGAGDGGADAATSPQSLLSRGRGGAGHGNALIPSAPTPRALAAAMVALLSNTTRATAMGAVATRVAKRFHEVCVSSSVCLRESGRAVRVRESDGARREASASRAAHPDESD